ncbi:rhombotarget lipoprotein [Aliikangiella sp. IMCC44359]|uniref:rhombotarget lipoprotein n=1 Tax=Aliikangiella sp. IMCC44359 TaxID=3459125 RepID=UPI00403B25C4
MSLFSKFHLKKFIWIILGTVLLSGCLHQVQRGTSSNLIKYLYPNGKKVVHSNDQLPHLKLPLRVGIAFIPETSPNIHSSLSETEKLKLLTKVSKKFENLPYVDSIEIIPELYMRQGRGFSTISQIATLHDIEVMALVSYDHLSITEENRLSLAYLTVVGAFFIPGETSHSQTFVDTAVFDVATQKLLFRAPGAATIINDHSFIGKVEQSRQLRNSTFEQATEKMTINLSLKLEEFRKRVKERKTVEVSYRKGYSGGGSYHWLGLIFLILLVKFSRNKI